MYFVIFRAFHENSGDKRVNNFRLAIVSQAVCLTLVDGEIVVGR
jgi:hypothetical protein